MFLFNRSRKIKKTKILPAGAATACETTAGAAKNDVHKIKIRKCKIK